MIPPPQPPSRLGSRALILAWLLLLGTLAAAVGYVLTLPEDQAAGTRVGLPVALSLPPETTAEAAGQAPAPAGAATRAITGVEAAEAGPAEVEVAEEPAPEAATAEPGPAEVEAAEAGPAEVEVAETAPPTPADADARSAPEAAPERAPEEPPERQAEAAPASEPAAAPQAAETPKPGAEQLAALPRAPTLPPAEMPLWLRHSQPFDKSDERPRIAVVLTGLGLSSAATEAAIKQLPPAITLSFTPYSRRLNQWVALARVNGHEVMLDLPMEPTSYPDDDPGPQALLTALSPRQNLERLSWALKRTTGYVGVATVMGSRFTASEGDLEPVLQELKQRGLLFLDNRSTEYSVAGALASKIGLPRAINDRSLDRAQASRVAVDARLVQLESIALTEGFAVAMGRPYPVTIERLREWSKDLGARGFALAPITALADLQPVQAARSALGQ
ncbi:MAG: divergent polysaccharide deacetylase family protein [Kiloniellaceae bacterium]